MPENGYSLHHDQFNATWKLTENADEALNPKPEANLVFLEVSLQGAKVPCLFQQIFLLCGWALFT